MGGGGGGGPSKLATALIIIFVISLIAFFAQLLYALWRRRVFRGQTAAAGDGGRGYADSQYSSSESCSTTAAYSKELLYSFCIRPRFGMRNSNSTDVDLNSDLQSDIDAVDMDLLKIHGTFGPPRFLFTIIEEDKEVMESAAGKSVRPIDIEVKIGLVDEKRSCAAASKDAAAEENENRGVIVDEVTPFWTPCGSPLYFTPTSSPDNEEVSRRSGSG